MSGHGHGCDEWNEQAWREHVEYARRSADALDVLLVSAARQLAEAAKVLPDLRPCDDGGCCGWPFDDPAEMASKLEQARSLLRDVGRFAALVQAKTALALVAADDQGGGQ